MPTLSYDLHVHPGPSARPRWGGGARVYQAAAAAGVRGFVWKAHEEHTVRRVRRLPATPVRVFGSASLNPWAQYADIVAAVQAGALWLWGPTMNPDGEISWDLPLPHSWGPVARFLTELRRPLILATGHLGAKGRAAFAALAAKNDLLLCSITHSLYLPQEEALRLAATGAVFEIDAYTYTNEIEGRIRGDVLEHVQALVGVGALVYFTSDGGQASTGNPFEFGERVLDAIAEKIGPETARLLGVENPASLVHRLDRAG
jgi:uncharacterized protein DUF6282